MNFASQFAFFVDNMRYHCNNVYIGSCMDLVRLCGKFNNWSTHYANTGNDIKMDAVAGKIGEWCKMYGLKAEMCSGRVKISKNGVDIGFVPVP